MGLHLFPKKLMHLINMIVSVICPAVKTYNLLLNKKDKQNEEYVQYIHFLTYWIIYSSYSYLEAVLLTHIMNYIPFYSEIKLMFFFWLYSDTFQGAGYIYFKFIEKNYALVDKKLCDLVQNKLPKNVASFFTFNKSDKKIQNKAKSTVSK
ncbi:YOP1-like protein [Plasmodium brasilianum]|uniref:HVA22-like protein, putative n=2 Tax=Plasmodium (Plasmodium) TaxID=418103 RepID=A0A1C3KZ72_PLAMA|nr:HVA22-like protein, putative [Plasmodium malariae]KAI4837137.1 YOP1-like protein [Plasmodium brasilianum]SBT79566.1 HVA22-like protein, putative [Plasmodium malariae]SCO93022.1 HVA22-like protein, putative [Plasmodium malariae]